MTGFSSESRSPSSHPSTRIGSFKKLSSVASNSWTTFERMESPERSPFQNLSFKRWRSAFKTWASDRTWTKGEDGKLFEQEENLIGVFLLCDGISIEASLRRPFYQAEPIFTSRLHSKITQIAFSSAPVKWLMELCNVSLFFNELLKMTKNLLKHVAKHSFLFRLDTPCSTQNRCRRLRNYRPTLHKSSSHRNHQICQTGSAAYTTLCRHHPFQPCHRWTFWASLVKSFARIAIMNWGQVRRW